MPRNDPSTPTPYLYIEAINGKRSTPEEEALDAATAKLEHTMTIPNLATNQTVHRMESGPEEANFLKILTQVVGDHGRPMKVIDVGTFTGRSALAMAQAMAMENGGTVISCEKNPDDIEDQEAKKEVEDWLAIAKEHWGKAGLFGSLDASTRIDLRLGEAKDTLKALVDRGEAGTFDMVFIDADKTGYEGYYKQAKDLVRPGGLIVLDNMLWSGRVAQPNTHDANTDALRKMNDTITDDPQVQPAFLSAGDGIMVARKLDPARFAKLAAGQGGGRVVS